MNQMGDYSIHMTKDEIAFICAALTWMKTDLNLGVGRAQTLGESEVVEAFEAHRPVLDFVRKSVLLQSIEQSAALGSKDELQSAVEEQAANLQKMQELWVQL